MWIDIRIRKPTAADGDKNGKVFQLMDNGDAMSFQWDNLHGTVAWMPIPPFNPPKIPEGWRVVDVETEKKTDKMRYWGQANENWIETVSGYYTKDFLYITPIEAETKYRPFANAAEFRPFAQKEWRYKENPPSTIRPPAPYCDDWHDGDSWDRSLKKKIFCDGTPFGMKVEQ